MNNFWNDRYNATAYAYGKQPNNYFKMQIDKLPVGKLLIPGAGEGRDAVYAATLGWQVTAFDLSTAGREKALQLASEFGVTIRYDITDAADFTAQPDIYNAVGLSYFHLPPAIRSALHRNIAASLLPGGAIILEAFNPKQLLNNSGGPKDSAMLPTPTILADDFQQLDIKQNEELEITLNEGHFHQGKADVVRFFATRNIK